jgi:hypothetical protein
MQAVNLIKAGALLIPGSNTFGPREGDGESPFGTPVVCCSSEIGALGTK